MLPAVTSAPLAALALSKDEAAAALLTFGLPDLLAKPGAKDGWQYVVEAFGLTSMNYYGKNKLGTQPMVASFYVPGGWVLGKPQIDFNGTSGTVTANDYTKGDSATLFVDLTAPKKSLDEYTKDDFVRLALLALSQRGKQLFENVEVDKFYDLKDVPGYKIVEFSWGITSGSGYQIQRTGYLCCTKATDPSQCQLLWSGTLLTRFRDTGTTIKEIVSSFRVAKIPDATKASVIEVATVNFQDPKYQANW